jgi:porphobilinogen deaminase
LELGQVDGVVVAEAALIRLKLTHLNRVYLPGDTTPLQGKLAVLVRNDAHELLALFSCIDSRKP